MSFQPAPPSRPPRLCPPPHLHILNGRGFTVVRLVLGALLLTTAILKLTGGSGEIMRTALPFVSPRVYSAGVLFEFLLGCFLISGFALAWSWAVSLAFFSLLTSLSLRMTLMGQENCGCFGSVSVSPSWALFTDLAVITALLLFRPNRVSDGIWVGLPTVAGGVAVFGVVLLATTLWFGSVDAAFARMRGELVIVKPDFVDIGVRSCGEAVRIPLQIENNRAERIRCVGVHAGCGGAAFVSLPIEVGPGETASTFLDLKFSGSPGEYRRRIFLYFEGLHLMPLSVVVTGKVTDGAVDFRAASGN